MDNWYFGWFSGVSFASGSPVALPGSTMVSEEGCVSQSDLQGNLLFYSDGGKDNIIGPPGGVRNANHQLMPNGEMSNGEGGCSSSPQSALVIQKNASEYYLFTIGCMNGQKLKWSIVDMSLDNGLGDLTIKGDTVPGLTGIFVSEGMTATKHANGVDHWLVIHGATSNNFYVFLITSTGITGPTTYSVGSQIGSGGQIKFNVQGNKIACNAEVFDFNNATGEISNPIVLGTDYFFGRAFSASGRYLYMRTIYGVMYQYDMNASDIGNSKILLASDTIAAGNLQLGPDLKIYGASLGAQYLSAVNNPELAGLACNYVVDQVLLPGVNSCQMGLPNFIDSELKYVLEANNSWEFNPLLEIYPNPFTSEIFIKNVKNIDELKIYSIDGKQICNWTYNEGVIDANDIKSGVYIVQYQGYSRRLVKK
jgi:hypothetical protein